MRKLVLQSTKFEAPTQRVNELAEMFTLIWNNNCLKWLEKRTAKVIPLLLPRHAILLAEFGAFPSTKDA